MVLSSDPRNWEETDPDVLEQCQTLYQGMPEAFNRILSSIVGIEEADAYTVIEGHGAAALESLQDVIDVMRAEGVELPDPTPIEPMKFEGDGRGGAFDARLLSYIL